MNSTSALRSRAVPLSFPLIELWTAVAIGSIALGILVRAHAFVTAGALEVDEQWFAINVLARSPLEFFQPLWLGQTAPPLYLLATKLSVGLLGFSDWSLRLPAFLADCLTLPLFWRLASARRPPAEAAIALALLAFGPTPIEYASIAKPYGADALATIVLLGLAWRHGDERLDGKSLARLAIVGAIALALATPSLFVLTGVGAALWLGRTDWRTRITLGIVAAIWAATGIGLMLTTHHDMLTRTVASGFMQDYWSGYFLTPDRWNKIGSLLRIGGAPTVDAFLASSSEAWTVVPELALLGLTIIGLVTCARQSGRTTGALLITPLVAVAVASAVRMYPLAPRVVLFADPITAIAIAAGVGALLQAIHPWRITLRMAALVVVLWYPARIALGNLARPRVRSRQAIMAGWIRSVAGSIPAGEPVYLSPVGVSAWIVYSTDWRKPDLGAVRRLTGLIDQGGLAPAFRRMRYLIGSPRPAVDSEFVVEWGSRSVLVGTDAGVWSGHRELPVDWGATQVRRMRSLGPCLTTIPYGLVDSEIEGLVDALSRAGATTQQRTIAGLQIPTRACFPPPS